MPTLGSHKKIMLRGCLAVIKIEASSDRRADVLAIGLYGII